MLAGAELPLLRAGRPPHEREAVRRRLRGPGCRPRRRARQGVHGGNASTRSSSKRRAGSSRSRTSTPSSAPIGEADALVIPRARPQVPGGGLHTGLVGCAGAHPAAPRRKRLSLRHRRGSGRGGAGELCVPRARMAPRRRRRRTDARRVAGGSSFRRGVLRPRRERDSALHGADRPRRPEGRRALSGAPTASPRSSRRVLRAARLSARARPRGGLASDPDGRRHICARGLEHPRAHRRPAGRGRRRVVDPAGQRDTCDARSPGRVLEGVSRAAALVCGDTARARLPRRHGGPAARARGVRGRPVGRSSDGCARSSRE